MKTFIFWVVMLFYVVTYGQLLSGGDVMEFLRSQNKASIEQKLKSLGFTYDGEKAEVKGKTYGYSITMSNGEKEQLDLMYEEDLLTDDPQFGVVYYLTSATDFDKVKDELVHSGAFVYVGKGKDGTTTNYKSKNNKIRLGVCHVFTKVKGFKGFQFSVPKEYLLLKQPPSELIEGDL